MPPQQFGPPELPSPCGTWTARPRTGHVALRHISTDHRVALHLDSATAITTALAWSPDSNLFAAGVERARTVIVWNVSNPLRPRRLPPLRYNHPSLPGVLTFGGSPPRWLAVHGSADQNWLWMWEIVHPQSSPRVAIFRGRTVRVVTFSPDGSSLVVGHDDDTGAMYSAETGDMVCRLHWDPQTGWHAQSDVAYATHSADWDFAGGATGG